MEHFELEKKILALKDGNFYEALDDLKKYIVEQSDKNPEFKNFILDYTRQANTDPNFEKGDQPGRGLRLVLQGSHQQASEHRYVDGDRLSCLSSFFEDKLEDTKIRALDNELKYTLNSITPPSLECKRI